MKNRIIYTLALLFATLQTFAQTYKYDANYRLVKVLYENGISVKYEYDVLGNRTSKTVTGATAQTYTITTAVTPTGSGTVTGGGTYAKGTTVELNAIANAGYDFSKWSDGNTTNPRTITVTKNQTFTAQFVVSTDILGDVNADGTVGIGDIVAVTNVMAGITNDAASKKRADVNGDGSVGIGDIVAITNIMAGTGGKTEPSLLSCPDNSHPHMIDLGLPSGTKWACCNVGANTPEEYGSYYAWGETEEKSVYNWETYLYGNSKDDVVNIGSDIAGTEYDAATANWGAPWHMPTWEQIRELLDNCSYTWTTQNSVRGGKFTGPNGGTVFLPGAGLRWEDNLGSVGWGGYYLSSTPLGEYEAYGLGFNPDEAWDGSYSRDDGPSVRPVSAPTSQPSTPNGNDFTAQVKLDASSWGGTGMVDWAAPEITTDDGRTTELAETYIHGMGLTGTVLEQTLTGLPNGTYKVELYANAYYTDGRGFSSDATEGQMDMVYLFANETKRYIPVHIGTEFSVSDEYSLTAKVTDGTLHMGMYSEKVGTNWWTIQIKSISRTSN